MNGWLFFLKVQSNRQMIALKIESYLLNNIEYELGAPDLNRFNAC